MEVRLAITNRLRSIPAFRHYTQDLIRADGARPTIELIPHASGDEDLRNGVYRVNRADGTVPDGSYRALLVARTAFHNQLFKQPLWLTDYLGNVEFRIHHGQLVMMSLSVGEVAKASLLHARLASTLNAVPHAALESKYPNARLALLDGRACDFRTAKHIERLFANFAGWPEFPAERLVHAIFVAPNREPGSYYRRGDFALTAGWRFGFPQALTLGDDRSCRVCVLATTVNGFGEPVDGTQTIVALEQVGAQPTVVREVLRVDAGEFNADVVNGLLAGGPAYSLIGGIVFAVVAVSFS